MEEKVTTVGKEIHRFLQKLKLQNIKNIHKSGKFLQNT
jgi:hypothetical protein